MAMLVEDRVGFERDFVELADIAALQAEMLVAIDMENLYDRNAARLGAVDQRLQAVGEGWQVVRLPVGALAEGFLDIDD